MQAPPRSSGAAEATGTRTSFEGVVVKILAAISFSVFLISAGLLWIEHIPGINDRVPGAQFPVAWSFAETFVPPLVILLLLCSGGVWLIKGKRKGLGAVLIGSLLTVTFRGGWGMINFFGLVLVNPWIAVFFRVVVSVYTGVRLLTRVGPTLS